MFRQNKTVDDLVSKVEQLQKENQKLIENLRETNLKLITLKDRFEEHYQRHHVYKPCYSGLAQKPE